MESIVKTTEGTQLLRQLAQLLAQDRQTRVSSYHTVHLYEVKLD